MKGIYAIVGMKYRGTEALVASLFPGESITLKREKTNRFDANAVQVWARKTHVGYLPKGMAAVLAKLMDGAGVEIAYGSYVPDRQPLVQVDESKLKGATHGNDDNRTAEGGDKAEG